MQFNIVQENHESFNPVILHAGEVKANKANNNSSGCNQEHVEIHIHSQMLLHQPMMASEVLTRDGLRDSNLNHDGIRDSDLNLQVPHLQFSQASLAGDGGQELGFTSHEFATKFPNHTFQTSQISRKKQIHITPWQESLSFLKQSLFTENREPPGGKQFTNEDDPCRAWCSLNQQITKAKTMIFIKENNAWRGAYLLQRTERREGRGWEQN